VFGGHLIRLFALILFVWFGALSSVASAAPADGDLPLTQACFIIGVPDADPNQLIQSNRRFDCNRGDREVGGDTIWVRYDLKPHAIEGATGWAYDHKLTQARDEQVWILFADGRIRKSPTAREASRRILGGPTQRFDFVREPGQIVALLARIDGLENRRGPVPRASLTSEARGVSNRANINLGYGLIAGIMFGIFFYNLTLFAALRYRMLAAYCGLIAATMFYGAVWSNFILWFVPGMSTATQFGWTALSISMCFLASAVYLESFVEPGMTSRRIAKAIYALSGLTVVFSIMRIFYFSDAWHVYDTMTYLAYLAVIVLIEINCIIAWRRGSTAVKLLFIAWAVPVAVIVLRIFWGLGSITSESAWFDASPFISLTFEAILSSIGLSWRLRQLRSERDHAEDRATWFRELATVDPLTGLLNRRAFLESAIVEGANRSLLIIDIDHFKMINDGWGHDYGDGVLRRVALALRDVVPDDAIIGRLGGEEFAVVCGPGAAQTLGQQIRLAVSLAASWPERHVTVSIGAAQGLLSDEADWRSLYVLADKALYASKNNGRDRVTFSHELSLAA
jgi:diguanylate cyclase (GGDEF)-like protein